MVNLIFKVSVVKVNIELMMKKKLYDKTEGQVRGISRMIEEDKYCNDILTQLLAVNKSIKSLSNDILKNHLETCVVDDIKDNKLEVIDEVMELIERLN